jgi:Alginate lyase
MKRSKSSIPPLLSAAALALFSWANLAVGDDAPGSAPRVFLLDGPFMHAARQRLHSGDTNLAPALARLEREARQALSAGPFSIVNKKLTPPSGDKHDYMSMAPYFWPNPDSADGLPYIRKDGERNPDIGKISDHKVMDEMAGAVETLALAYYFKGDEACAAGAAQLLRVWYLEPATRMNPNLQYAQAVTGANTGRGIGIIESRGLTRVVDAIGLLAGSKAWTESDDRGLHEWFAKFLKWMRESANGRAEAAAKNNHGTYYDIQAVSFALFLGQKNLATDILKTAREKRIAVQIEPDGSQPLELVRTKAWGYSVGNLSGLMLLATLGDDVGVDLWNYHTKDGRSIRKALDYLTPFAFDEKKWSYQQLGEWPPQMLYSSIRKAALKYPDAQYQSLVSKLPKVELENRSNLLSPKPGGQELAEKKAP